MLASVLLSIILGLGFTQLFAAVGRLIRDRDRVQVDAVPLLWAAVLVLLYVQVWWSMYGLRLHTQWTFGEFGAVLATSLAKDLMLAGHLPDATNLGFHGAFALIGVAGLVTRPRAGQFALALSGVLVIVAYIGVLFARLQ